MSTGYLLSYFAAALAVGGLAAIVWEIAAKAPGLFREISEDTRLFAERPLPAAPREPVPVLDPASADAVGVPPLEGPKQSRRRAA